MNDMTPAFKDVTGSTLSGQSAHCPYHARSVVQPAAVDMDDKLIFPQHKRLLARYTKVDTGSMELHLDYGEKEITFDEPELFAFAEGLTRNAQFIAGTATTWGQGYAWSQIRPLLEQLVEEGILQHADPDADEQGPPEHSLPSPLPPATTTIPRFWFECEAITAELTGRALELGYLELVIPIYRIAHPAMDAEGRQVGEANVFPKPLRLDIPTEWRLCPHVGSRYHDDLPMNVTALKTMRQHWSQCMAALRIIRAAYLRRFPLVLERGWTVGDLQRLSTMVLTLPAYLLMRAERPVANGELHPVLSNLFRITDGARMTLHYMMFMPMNEPTLPPEAPTTVEEIYAYAERNNLFLSDYGVCAGPKAMIEEFLQVLVSGKRPADGDTVTLDADVEAALAAIEPSFDYGLLGLQVHAVVNCLWPVMIRTYDSLGAVLDSWPDDTTAALQRFRASIRDKNGIFKNRSVFSTEAMRLNREHVLADMFGQCGRGLGEPATAPSLAQCIAPAGDAQPAAAEQLHRLLRARLRGSPADDGGLERLTEILMDYFRREQAIVRAACRIQPRINRLLGRTDPVRPFRASDINLYFVMQDGPRRLPYLVAEELEGMLGLQVVVTTDRIEFSESD